MSKIATEQEARSIGNYGTVNPNKCCTKAQAESYNCIVDGEYQPNQLIQLSDVRPKYVYCDLHILLDTPNDLEFRALWVHFDWDINGDYVEEVDVSPYFEQHYPRFAVSNGGEMILKDVILEECVAWDNYMEEDTYLSMQNWDFRDKGKTDTYTLTITVTDQ